MRSSPLLLCRSRAWLLVLSPRRALVLCASRRASPCRALPCVTPHEKSSTPDMHSVSEPHAFWASRAGPSRKNQSSRDCLHNRGNEVVCFVNAGVFRPIGGQVVAGFGALRATSDSSAP